jgi:hypothetical protein
MVVMELGTLICAVVVHAAVNVKVVPVRSPAHGPSVEATALATPPPVSTTETRPDASNMTHARPIRRRNITASLMLNTRLKTA